MSLDLFSFAVLYRPQKSGQNSKKYLFQNKELNFRKILVLEPVILLKTILHSLNLPYFYKTL